MLDLASLEIFQSVAREGSVSGAAHRLNRVQSNVSTRLKQLEERVGAKLFSRSRQGFKLTEDGERLLGYADKLIALAREAAETMSDGRPHGTFRIGTMESTGAVRLPSILSQYHTQFPEVEIHVHTDIVANLINQLLQGDLDIAFIAEPVSNERLETQPVFVEELVLIGPGKRGSSISPTELTGKTMIAFEEGCAYRRYLQNWLLENQITPGTTLSVGSYLAMLSCVSAGTGFAVIPQSVLDLISSEGEFGRHPLGGRYTRIQTLLVSKKGCRSSNIDALDELMS